MNTFLQIYLIISLVIALLILLRYYRDEKHILALKSVGGQIGELLIAFIVFTVGWPVMVGLFIRFLLIMKK